MRSSRPLRTTGTEAERLLLAAGLEEAPDDESVRRAAEALGFLPRALVFGGALALALRSLRWTSIAAGAAVPLAGLGVVAVIAHGTGARAIEAAAPARAPVGATTGAPRAAGPPADDAPADEAPADDAPGATPRGADPADRGPRAWGRHAAPRATRGTKAIEAPAVAAGPRSESADRLREEAARLDRARTQIAAGDADGALATLDDHDRRFARGPLADESLVLRVEALARRGDDAGAASLARRFLATHPASLHADRLNALLARLAP